MNYTYDRRAGQYRGSDGRFVSPATITNLVGTTQDALSRALIAQSTKLSSNQISLAQWQARTLSELKSVHYQLALLGSGGADVSQLVERAAVANAAEIDRMGRAIASGQYSTAQILNYSANFANSTKATFYEAQTEARKVTGVKTARRILDGQSRHCSDCLRLAGLGYVSLAELVLPTEDCDCGAGCKCSVVYRWY